MNANDTARTTSATAAAAILDALILDAAPSRLCVSVSAPFGVQREAERRMCDELEWAAWAKAIHGPHPREARALMPAWVTARAWDRVFQRRVSSAQIRASLADEGK